MAKNKRVFDHEGNEFANLNEMCDAWGISIRTFRSRKEDGWTLKRILETKDKIYELKSTQGDQYPKSLKKIMKNISAYDFFAVIDKININIFD